MTDAFAIRPATVADASPCADIFAYYAKHTDANLREEPLPLSYFDELIGKADSNAPFVVADEGGKITGYAYADLWRTRCGYEYTVEVSVYVDKEHVGKRAGEKLLAALLDELQKGKMQTAVAFITMPNPISVKLHEKFGFVASGELPGVGHKFNTMRDVGIWLKHLR